MIVVVIEGCGMCAVFTSVYIHAPVSKANLIYGQLMLLVSEVKWRPCLY